jgi:hypothetical protein
MILLGPASEKSVWCLECGMSEKPADRRFPRMLRLPSFGVALGVSLAALLAFAFGCSSMRHVP